MVIKDQVKLKLLGVDFPVVNFESKQLYDKKNKIHIDVKPRLFFPEDDNKIFRIIMEVRLTEDTSFELFVVSMGTFMLSEDLNKEDKKSLVNVNAPAILFPYIRSFIATLTANLGVNTINTLNIPPQFFNGELEEIRTQNDD